MSETTSSPISSDPLLTVQQVADFLGTSLRTVQRRIADNSIRTLKLGRIVRIPASEIGRLLERNDGTIQSVTNQSLTK